MRCSKDGFDRLVDRKRDVHPWNEARRTRNSHCCKWVVLAGPTTSLWNSNIHRLLATSTLPNGHVASLTVDEVAIPVPQELDDIIGTMDCWGVRVSGLWKRKVIHALVKKCSKGGEIPMRKSMCFSLTAMLLHELLGAAVNSREFDEMMFACCVCCRSICSRSKRFFDLTVKCKRWLEDNCLQAAVTAHQHATTAVAVTPERPTSSASSIASSER